MCKPRGSVRISAVLAVFLLLGAVRPLWAEEQPGPFDAMIGRITGGGTRTDLFDLIEKGEAERARQDAERAAREAETRAILVDIREKIFAIRLNIAAIEGRQPTCDARRRQDVALGAQMEDLDRLGASARRACEAAGPSGAGIAALCRGRLDEIAAERGTIERQRAAALKCEEQGRAER